jgi:hypothetical protein
MTCALAFLFMVFLIKPNDTNATEAFELKGHLQGINSFNALDSFPYGAYLASRSIADLPAVKKDLNLLDSLKLDGGLLLSVAFTDRLKPEPSFKKYFTEFDKLAELICIAEKYKVAAELDTEHRLFYESVWDEWLNCCANFLTDTAARNSMVRHNHRFMFLVDRLNENQHTYAAPPMSDADKVLYHISETNWGYLLERFWTRTQWWFKILLVLLSLLFVVGQIAIYKLIKLRKT